MRLAILLLLSLLVVVEGRRGSPPAPAVAPKKRAILSQWGYPYGWGLNVMPAEEETARVVEDDTQKVKPVKRGTFEKSIGDPICLSVQ